MQDLSLPGWKLTEIPDNPNQICQVWLEHYANGDPLSSDKLQFLVDRALIHQALLQEVLEGVES
jgi:polysaccharide pyruvyl transferase WcaK-like protein